MATDPGDLVLDPTCGSGTTAYVCEQWGRRWITIDTSRVALALARSRIMGARYPFYLLADSEEGQIKESLLGRTLDISRGGIQLEVDNRYPLSSEFEVRLQIYEDIIKLRGKVVHVEELKNGKVGLGIRFTQMPDQTRVILEEFLSSGK